ncbi:MAG: DUF4367 domain-containing protein [Candidatus Promineifilaceae bacterium]
MNDNKLHTFRRTPDQVFVDKLFHHIEQIPLSDTTSLPQQSAPRRKSRIAWAFAVLIVVILLMVLVPRVRARFDDILKEIGGIPIFITEDYPFSDHPNIVQDDIITLEEADDRLGFEFNLPTYMPEGMVLKEDEVHASNITNNVTLIWDDAAVPGRILRLIVERENDIGWAVGPDSVTEVMVNDIPASLMQGGWNEDTKKWQDYGNRDLSWQLDGVKYTLSSGSVELGGLSNEELIKIAESIAPMAAEEGSSIRPDGE